MCNVLGVKKKIKKLYGSFEVSETKLSIFVMWLWSYIFIDSLLLFLSIAAVESVQKDGKICILDIDVQGAQKVKESSLDVRDSNK